MGPLVISLGGVRLDNAFSSKRDRAGLLARPGYLMSV
jgi:hypothetical protein